MSETKFTPRPHYFWTTERPVAPGWYWAIEPGEEPAIFEVMEDISGLTVWFPTPPAVDDLYPLHGFRVALEAFSHWAGPIQEPAGEVSGEGIEERAQRIYESWSGEPGYVPWVVGGNSLKQEEARAKARGEGSE